MIGLGIRVSISIHALREEGDSAKKRYSYIADRFLSTPSARRATRRILRVYGTARQISIHALREEGDYGSDGSEAKKEIFLSTPSARRATHAA